MPNPQRLARVLAAWAEDPALPTLRCVLEHEGFCQLRAYRKTPDGRMSLAVQLLADGTMQIELTAAGTCIAPVAKALDRMAAANGEEPS